MTMITNAIYVDGVRAAEPSSLERTFEELRRRGGVAWIALYRPDEQEMRQVADEFSLHDLAVEDTVRAHQRSKLERYDRTDFIVLRPAMIAAGRVEVGELHLFVGPNFVVSVRHAESPDLAGVRARLEADPTELGLGPTAILYAILDQLVDDYAPVVAHLLEAIDDVEDALFSGDRDVPRRIYQHIRDIIALQRAVHPLVEILEQLTGHDAMQSATEIENDQLRAHLRDVFDHVLRIAGQLDSYRDILASGLQLHTALVSQQQNEEMARMTETALRQGEQTKKVSAWAAILFTPTVVAGIYGMNFTNMPELDWFLGYPYALAIMLAAATTLYVVFKRQRWL
ncbi:magnesium and cobalt transport protein CorA [Pseudactinotalea sp. HY158]|uniref:magnesium and cobalt transport protein CorA n=1 Tax=Pseudactinotalea sp. HY158 TaxID=2654547 RepID=UPI00129C4ACF|nr:magnesium and cobalt transport protein CorA [Pseudactinotalea sp. HY158]QGH69139.1 transporter [Pseudactinotalea sp. HY158]